MQKKKIYVSLGIVGAIGIATTAIVVPASLKKHKEKYEVSIAKANGAHYTILRLNPSTNKGSIPELNIWDVLKSNQQGLSDIAKALKMKEVSQLLPTISGNKPYKNGLEKFIYDLLKLENNGSQLTIVSPVKNSNKKNYTIKFDEKFINPTGNEKQKIKIRSKILLDMLKNQDDNSRSFQEGLTKINIYDNVSKKIIPTSIKMIEDAIKKFTPA